MRFVASGWETLRDLAQPFVSTKFEANKIVDGLWLGSLQSAHSLKKGEFDHLISVSCGRISSPKFLKSHTIIDIRDVRDEAIHEHFRHTNSIIANAIKNNEHVLVHCMAGVSRSATLVAAYLISTGMTDVEALSHIQMRRPCINPNKGFRIQLQNFYFTLQSQKEVREITSGEE